ncbi:probable ascorbate-specific transmembrane electron transporter 2 [Rutidosis leptorrhynchoides]|uniref:probable ascorbate-specific transmembrane electron transporter 2 n=1 Tax=Rutidosis leptorrhynchoides TaxID=125765 RepID=UPI003A9A011D
MANERLRYRMSALYVTVFAHLLVVSITTLVLFWLIKLREGFALKSDIKMKIFNLHPLLTILGFIVFSGEAILTYKAIPASRPVLKLIHFIFHLIALTTGILGVYAVFKFHNEVAIAHMYTLHSWIGLSTICLFALQLLIGLVTFVYPGAESATRARFAPWHVFFGVVIFYMAIVTVETGLSENFIFKKLQHGQEALMVNFIGLLILLFGVAVGLTSVLSLRRK